MALIEATVGDLYDRCVRFYGTRTAIKYGDRAYRYDELGRNAASLANALAHMGIGAGDRVALLMANCPEYVFCEYALAKLGAVRVPLAVALSPNDHVFMMNQSECTALIYQSAMAPRVQVMLPLLETVKQFICIGGDRKDAPTGHLRLEELLASYPPEMPHVAVARDDLCSIYYTGGTTGRPKGVMLSHRSWIGTYLTEMLELGLGEDEVFAFATPLTHAGGCLLVAVMLRRGVCVILDHFDAQGFFRAVEKERITATFLVPTMIYMLLDHPDRPNHDLRSLRNVVYGAAAIAPQRLKQAINTFGPVFTQLYGQTEAPMMISVLSRQEHVIADPEMEKRIFSSCGRPTLPARVRIVDEAGLDVPSGTVGEIIARHTNMMDGYLKNPEATAETIGDGWLHTGDLARQDEEGFLYIVDRSKDMVVSGGFNIYPREIEDALHEHPAVKNVAVVGVPDAKWGEAVKALVVRHEGASVAEDELIAFVKERKGSLVAPKSVEFCETIPLTNLGKLDKKAIRERFWQGYERRV